MLKWNIFVQFNTSLSLKGVCSISLHRQMSLLTAVSLTGLLVRGATLNTSPRGELQRESPVLIKQPLQLNWHTSRSHFYILWIYLTCPPVKELIGSVCKEGAKLVRRLDGPSVSHRGFVVVHGATRDTLPD